MKDWGSSLKLYPNVFINTVNAGGFCSKHLHERKKQVVTVMRGVLTVNQFLHDHDEDPTYIYVLHSGESLLTMPFEVHQFEARGECVFLETYLPATDGGPEPEDSDIVRFSPAGIR